MYVEIAARELDSKLLLATLAAAKGHQVVVSDLSGIMKGIQKGALAPGIFHDKSLTPNANKIATHQFVIDNGFVVISLHRIDILSKQLDIPRQFLGGGLKMWKL